MDKWELESILENIVKNSSYNPRTRIEAARVLSAMKGWIPPIFSVTAVADSNEN